MEKENQLSDFFNGYNRDRSSSSEDKTAPDIGNLKYRIDEIFMSRFLDHNEGKFNQPLEMNPPIHAVAEFCKEYGNLCWNKAIEEAGKKNNSEGLLKNMLHQIEGCLENPNEVDWPTLLKSWKRRIENKLMH